MTDDVFTVPTPENPLCDFCGSSNPKWQYEAQDFEQWRVGRIAGMSIGFWAACDTCKEMIEAGERESLAERSTVALIAKAKVEFVFTRAQMEKFSAVCRGQVKAIHDRFFQHKKGGPTAITS